MIDGNVAWCVNGRDLLVDANSFLVLGDGEKYSMDVDMPRPIETCCAFFERGFAEEIARDATTPIEASLDDPSRPAPPLQFLSRLHLDPEGTIVRHLQTLAARCSEHLQPSSVEEDFFLLAKNLLFLYDQVSRQISRVPAVKASTREEVFRRLQTAKEYLHSHHDQPVSLDEVARTACLSRYHFHRSFTQVFERTPHAYLTSVRLARAQSLLRSGVPVLEACVEVGFTSQSSFGRLFRAHYGVPPSAIRKIGPAQTHVRG